MPKRDRFREAAAKYCEARLRYLELKRDLAETYWDCERVEHTSTPEGWDVYHGNPCHRNDDLADPYSGEMDEDEYCEVCKARLPILEERRAVGLRLAGLASAMYQAYRMGG
jgi:hypothetical protein